MKWYLALSAACCFILPSLPASGQDEPALRAVIIGSGSPQYNAERNGPSVLIEYGDVHILVDAGNGTQAGLSAANRPIRDLDAIVFTHHHLDHNEEFIPIFIQTLLGGNPFHIVGPTPMQAMVDGVLSLYKEDISYRLGRRGRTLSDVEGGVSVTESVGGEAFAIGAIAVRTAKVEHTIAANAYRFDAGGQSIVVSGDLVYSPSLSELAKGADILIIDSGGTVKQNQAQTGGERRRQGAGQGGAGQGRGGRVRAHVNLAETAQMAQDAGVDTIVLTHFTVGTNDEAATIAELRKGYSGKIIFAVDQMIVSDR